MQPWMLQLLFWWVTLFKLKGRKTMLGQHDIFGGAPTVTVDEGQGMQSMHQGLISECEPFHDDRWLGLML